MRSVALASAALLVLLATGNVVAEPSSDECSARVAEKATVRQAAENPTEFDGRCVTIDGVMGRYFLYDDVDGVYLMPRNYANPTSSGARLGLWGRLYDDSRFRHVSIVGRVHDCESLRASLERPGEVILLSGYCHHMGGAYLWIEDLRLRKGVPLERRMGAYGRPGYGNLEPAPPDWPHRARVESLAREFVEALRYADRDRLAALHIRKAGLEREESEALMHFLLEDRESPFAGMRGNDTPPQQQILIAREWGSEGDKRDARPEAHDYSATVCFCREADCTGRWPIAGFDADNLRIRPYACTHIGPYLVGAKHIEVPHFWIHIGSEGLAEPAKR